MARISDLFDLQKVDYNAIKVRQQFQQIQKSLNGNETLSVAKQKFQTSQSKLVEWEAQQKNLELESQSLTTRISETDSQLMSGTVTSHKELEALQASLESLKRQKEAVETQSVNAMEKVEEITARLESLRSEFQSLQSDWKDKATSLQEDGKKLQQQFKVLKKKRESLIKALDKDSLALYEQLRKRKGGVAVAPLQGDTCGACNMQVPSGVISSARIAEVDPVYCPSCGRILYGNN